MKRRVLIVEDEPDLAALIKRHLDENGFQSEIAIRGDTGLRLAETDMFDLILLDLMLPGMDGLELCRRLRAKGRHMPVLMVTARTTEVETVLGFESGADDYIAKPFGIAELVARVKAILRRVDNWTLAQPTERRPIICGSELRIDPEFRTVQTRDGTNVNLTPKEFDLLLYFVRHRGRVFTRAQLLDAVWGYSHEGYEHAVNCHINRLRLKIESDPAKPKLLLTVWGIGYKFAEQVAGES